MNIIKSIFFNLIIFIYLSSICIADVKTNHEPICMNKYMINKFGMKFIYLKPGSFIMGSHENEPGRHDDENQHVVSITKGFYIQSTEVTQEQWKQIMGNNPSFFKKCGEECPVECVSWHEVHDFLEAINRIDLANNYRLPTESEWEFACRADTKTAYYNGDLNLIGKNNAPIMDQISWYAGNSCVTYEGANDCSSWPEKQYDCKSCGPHPVGLKQPNAWGLYDMNGNVWEWCEDWWSESYPQGHVADPQGPILGKKRIIRGGGWDSYPIASRNAARGNDPPETVHFAIGFRLVCTPLK